MNYYTIKDLETLSGIKAHTIRIWEKRYGLLVPERTTTNIRFYTDDELKHMLNVAALVKRGHKISKVSAYSNDQIHEEVLKLNIKSSSMDDYLDQLVIHIVDFDTLKFESLLDELQTRFGFEKFIVELVFPLFHKIGVYWQIGSMFPAQEHLISNLIRKRLIIESSKFKPAANPQTALFFLPEGELHELGLLFVQYLVVKHHFKPIYLGQNVPFEDLKNMAGNTSFDLVVTSFVNVKEKAEMEEYLNELSAVFNSSRILISGQQVRIQQPELPANVHFISHSQDVGDLIAQIKRR
ncbi:MerR family transcriptional regulator [Mangrovibacterium sp.]|uniref:MerR family transcriptional regulator n=1 Tax=Mangrovibacterium sp. TaxID=1961364 RepID=UPI00356A44BF